MQWTRKLSLRRKLTLVIMINTFVALCAAGIGFAEYGVYRFKELRLEDLNALANILGTNSTAPLAFKDPNSAQDILQALAAKPHILSAVIYDRDGKPFAVYHRGASANKYSAPPVESESSRFTSNRVLIFQAIIFQDEKVGTVFLEGDTVEYKQLLVGYLFFFALIVAVVSLGAYVMAGRLQRPISNPILELAWTTKMVTSTRDYSIRAGKRSEDEVGVLIDGFNEMLGQIQIRDAELRHAREDLERRWTNARPSWNRKWRTASAPRKHCMRARDESGCFWIPRPRRSMESIGKENARFAIRPQFECWATNGETPCWARICTGGAPFACGWDSLPGSGLPDLQFGAPGRRGSLGRRSFLARGWHEFSGRILGVSHPQGGRGRRRRRHVPGHHRSASERKRLCSRPRKRPRQPAAPRANSWPT